LKAGVFYDNVEGFRLSTGVQLAIVKPVWKLFIAPRIDLTKETAYEMFMAGEFMPAINEKLRLYSRLQLMSNINRHQHLRSYQFVRVGISCRKLQMGGGLN